MGAEAPSPINAHAGSQLHADGGFLSAILGEVRDDSLRGGGRFAVVDELGGSRLGHGGTKGLNPWIGLLVHQGKMTWITEQNRLEFVELDVGDKPPIVHVIRKRLLKGQHSRAGNISLFFPLGLAWEAIVQRV